MLYCQFSHFYVNCKTDLQKQVLKLMQWKEMTSLTVCFEVWSSNMAACLKQSVLCYFSVRLQIPLNAQSTTSLRRSSLRLNSKGCAHAARAARPTKQRAEPGRRPHSLAAAHLRLPVQRSSGAHLPRIPSFLS